MATTGRLVPARRVGAPFFAPFRVFDDNRNLIDLFDAAFAGLEPARIATAAWTPAVTVEETEQAYIVEAELPGIKREDISVELDDNVLHVHGETTAVERTGEVRHQTRRTGKFDYRLALPGEVDADKVEATLTDGVLKLGLPKAGPAQARQITISTETAATANTTETETPADGATES
ncbi:Hsp20/alpha crystallin family protein [Gordonia sp. NB41Y]|uniref:Hsp20/alpha crystallin family protein n=1 Tax=Gordonia sp. NB41Y TaxID=875808 RepID=UPI0002BDAB3C|nr:Hsp20/alpha crystallin family protein [Gordonia sp. NB41Y]EMP10305.1 heat-shock protein [Gordonia sp. NB41Y]WLP92320.1 Hsp20/alpha crystallin family protein [Gordonia sp. NB41Y]